MAEFLNPFSGLAPERKLSARELSRAIRLALAAEEEAIHLYEALADATDHSLAKAVLQDVADEERVHAGEFQRVLSLLLPDEDARMRKGADEVDDLQKQVAGGGTPAGGGEPATVGDIKGEDK